jgi:hypothetical protein
MKSLNKIIPISIYPYDLMISFNESDREFKKALSKFGVSPKNSTETTVYEMDNIKIFVGRMVMFRGKQTVIRMNFMPKLTDPFQMSLLQHEIFHAATFFMIEIRTPLKNSTHEVYAYLIQFLTEKIYVELK